MTDTEDPYRQGYNEGYRDAENDFDVDCDRDHCDNRSCSCPEAVESDVDGLVRDYLRQIRMGYTLDVTLQDVLEEMERIIRD